RRNRLWRKIRRQGNGTGFGAVARKVIEEFLDRLTQSRDIVDVVQTGRFLQPLHHLGPIQAEDQIVCSQARHVAGRVESGQWVVEIVGQKDLFEMRSPEDLLFPSGLS